MESSDLLYGIPDEVLERLVSLEYHDPHSILGAHPIGGNSTVIRIFHPDAVAVDLLIESKNLPMSLVHPQGLFAIKIDKPWTFDYRLLFYHSSGKTWERRDPYRFPPTLDKADLYLIGEGHHLELYRVMGAHPRKLEGIKGVSFALWDPNALRVSVIGDFNQWDGRIYPMRVLDNSGIWEIFIPDVEVGATYKYEIKNKKRDVRKNIDPFAFYMEERPNNASIVWDVNKYQWGDKKWCKERKRNYHKEPMNIYEMHVGSWMRVPEEKNRCLTYSEIAPKLIKHMKEYGFTHVELMTIMEHPLDESWSYQTIGYYAPTSRYGTPDEFKFFVDTCHQNKIGVILDWAPDNFPKDDFPAKCLDKTDGSEHSFLHVYEDPERRSLIFNFEKNELRDFLLSSALFWLDVYHADGIRTDALPSMLFRDHERKDSKQFSKKFEGKKSTEAVSFIRQLNEDVHARFPGCFTIAEESIACFGVSHPTYQGGMGFGFKWNTGWSHDTLSYFSKNPIDKERKEDKKIFHAINTYNEYYTLPMSHNEVLPGKGSLLSKMPGDRWQKFASLRSLLSYMYTHPGKKLLFMGTELAPEHAWDPKDSLDWQLLNDPDRQAFGKFLKDLGNLYLKERSLWQEDSTPLGFSWIDCDDSKQSVFSYLRMTKKGDSLLCIFNRGSTPRFNYRIGIPEKKIYQETFNTDLARYGGSNVKNDKDVQADNFPWHSFSFSLNLILPPLSCLIFKPC